MDIQSEMFLAALGENLADWTLDGHPLKGATLENENVTLTTDAGTHVIPAKGWKRFDFVNASRWGLTEAEKIEVWDRHSTWSPPDPFNSFSCLNNPPENVLMHTLVNETRVRNNTEALAAQEEQRREHEAKEHAEFQSSRTAYLEAFQRDRVEPFAASLIGKTIESLTLQNGRLVIQTKDAPSLEVRVQSVGVRSEFGIVDSPELTLKCGEKELSGHASDYRPK